MYKFLLVLSFLVCPYLNVLALRVVPFIYSFDPEDKNENAFQYYIENKTDSHMAFGILVYRRYQDEYGRDKLIKDEKSFRVRPTQIIIPPHTQRNVKVKWIGNEEFRKNPNVEQAYRVCMTQFPIDLNQKRARQKGASLEVTYEIKTSLYATPKDAKANLIVASHDANKIVLKNEGSKRAEVQYCELTINGKKVTTLLNPKDQNVVVMPGNAMIFKKKDSNNDKKVTTLIKPKDKKCPHNARKRNNISEEEFKIKSN